MKQILVKFGALALAAMAALSQASPAAAEGKARPLVVVELFTSQGCSSCPPADAMIMEMAARKDLLPLSLHVDYWDYLGWRDDLAQPQFTQRQKAYARMAEQRSIYTPQMIVQGLDHVIGAKAMKLMDAVETRRALLSDMPVSLSHEMTAAGVTVTAQATGPLPPKMRLQLVRYTPHVAVAIGRGENAGRTIDYANVVTSWTAVADWDGAAPLSVPMTLEGDDRAAVILQADGPGAIRAALRLN